MSQRCARQDSGARRVRHTELWLIHSGITMLAIVMAVPTQDVNMVHTNCMAPTLTDNSQQQTGCVDCPSRHDACSRVCSQSLGWAEDRAGVWRTRRSGGERREKLIRDCKQAPKSFCRDPVVDGGVVLGRGRSGYGLGDGARTGVCRKKWLRSVTTSSEEGDLMEVRVMEPTAGTGRKNLGRAGQARSDQTRTAGLAV